MRGSRSKLNLLEDSDFGIVNKKEITQMAKNINNTIEMDSAELQKVMRASATSKAGFCEYKMPRAMAQQLLKNRKGEDAKMRPNDFLCKVVNENFGLKEYCVKVTQSDGSI